MSEINQQQLIREMSMQCGTPLLRNNSGATLDEKGRMIRFGLGNDSAKINKVFKSSDLIGIRPVRIGPEHVGMVIGQFFAVEVKALGWRHRGTEREVAQQNFGDWVTRHGGHFQFATKPEDVVIWV